MDTDGLSLICGGLGSLGNLAGYTKGEHCLDNLKDLLRFMRRDDPETRDVFKQVCKWRIVSNDLIPIIECYQDDRNLVLNAVKVLVFLTMPLENASKDFNEQLEYLCAIKSAVTSCDVIAIVVSLLEKPLENLESEEFSEDDWKLVQLVLTLFRNMLAVQDISVQQTATGSANLFLVQRDNFIEKLFEENVMDVITVITQHVSGSCRYLRHDTLLLLEIYHYIFLGQDPELTVKARLEDSKAKGDTGDCLESVKSVTHEAEKRKAIKLRASRHSRFSGAFTRLTMDGSKTMCKGMPTPASCDKLLKPEKVHRGPSKRVMKDYTRLPTRKRRILELLHDLLNQFLTGGYNELMQSIAEDIEKDHENIQNSDVLMFFQLAQFITSFQYHKTLLTKSDAEAKHVSSLSDDDDSTWLKGDICGSIAATINESMFELVFAKWRLAFEGLKETKNNAFLSAAGSLMKIMIRMLDLALKLMPDSSKEPQTVRVLLHKLFYDQTDQGFTQFLMNMIRSFDAHKQPKSDLADLVEIMYVVIQLMEKLQEHGALKVAKKSRKTKRSSTDDRKNTENKIVGDNDPIQNDIQHPDREDPPDASTNETESLLQTGSDGKEENCNVHIPVDAETSKIKTTNLDESPLPGDCEESNEIHDNFIAGTNDSDFSADEQPAATQEVDLKITSYLLPLANSTIISNLCWLLKFYQSNSISSNHYILCMLKRVCDDLDLAPMLYQLSCLVIFYDILNEQKACPQKEYESIVQFLTSLTGRMLRKMKSQPLLFLDLLCWKTRKDCHYINVESIHHKVGEMQKEVRNWGTVKEGDLSGGKQHTWKDALGDDEFDVSIPNESNFQKYDDLDDAAGEKVVQSTGNVVNKLHAKGDPKGPKRNKRLLLSDKLEEEIRGLFEKYKDNPNCTQLIAEALGPDRNISPAQVSRKCKKLGLTLLSKNSINLAQPSMGNNQDNEGTVEIDSNLPSSNNPDGPSFMRKPTKRVRALDKNQEQKIRVLFEQFKDLKRCSHMIAKELDPDGAVTAAQVSRRLKKLGLRTSQMRTNKNSKDDADASTDGEYADDLPLSSLRNRGKNMDVSLSSKSLEDLSDTSDDELLISVRKKSRLGHSEGDERMSKSIEKGITGQDLGNETIQGLVERSERGQTDVAGINAGTRKPNSPTSPSEDETPGTSTLGETDSSFLNQTKSEKQTDSWTRENDDSDVQSVDKHNELEDSGDEQIQASVSVSPKSSAKRRKLRMVLDFDDDDE